MSFKIWLILLASWFTCDCRLLYAVAAEPFQPPVIVSITVCRREISPWIKELTEEILPLNATISSSVMVNCCPAMLCPPSDGGVRDRPTHGTPPPRGGRRSQSG